MFKRRNGETGRTDKEVDKREISTAMGSKRNAKDRTNAEWNYLKENYVWSGASRVD